MINSFNRFNCTLRANAWQGPAIAILSYCHLGLYLKNKAQVCHIDKLEPYMSLLLIFLRNALLSLLYCHRHIE